MDVLQKFLTALAAKQVSPNVLPRARKGEEWGGGRGYGREGGSQDSRPSGMFKCSHQR